MGVVHTWLDCPLPPAAWWAASAVNACRPAGAWPAAGSWWLGCHGPPNASATALQSAWRAPLAPAPLLRRAAGFGLTVGYTEMDSVVVLETTEALNKYVDKQASERVAPCKGLAGSRAAAGRRGLPWGARMARHRAACSGRRSSFNSPLAAALTSRSSQQRTLPSPASAASAAPLRR